MNIVKILGWVLIVVGVLGFIPGITSDGMLLGIFEVDAVHSIIHIITGALLVMMAANKMLVMVLGIIYLLLGVLGYVMASPLLGFLHVNGMDNILHLVLGALLVWGAMKMGKGAAPAAM